MAYALTARTLRRLDIQGFDCVAEQQLAEVAPWFRLAYALCALLAGIGTAAASPVFLVALSPIALLGAVLPVHPFDLIYNLGIRRLTGTGPLPKRGAPVRFGCGVGTVWMLGTAWAFSAGHTLVGYVLGFALTGLALMIGTTDICVPSMMYRALFGPPRPRTPRREA